MRSAWTLGPALLMALLGACESDQTDPPPAPQAASVVLTPASATLLELDSFAISVTLLDPAGRVLSGRTINWESSDYSIATPQAPSAGWVQAGRPGTATIRASVSPENVFGTTEVTVLERPIGSVDYNGLAVGHDHSCGRTVDGEWFCWGANFVLQILGAPSGQSEPRRMQTPLSFDTLVASVHYGSVLLPGPVVVCGVALGGAAYCWGQDDAGAIGDGPEGQGTCSIVRGIDLPNFEFDCADEPRLVAGGLTWRSLTTGGSTTCGLTIDGSAYCWGANQYGQLGRSGTGEQCQMVVNYEFGRATGVPCSTAPVAVSGGHTFDQIAAGGQSACALTAGGQAWCWGDNSLGQLGNGSTTSSSTPVVVAGNLVFRQITLSGVQACGVTVNNHGYCWGYGGKGPNVGVAPDACSSRPCSTVPTAIAGNLEFAVISAGEAHACGVTTAGAGYCWGYAGLGMLGGATESCPAWNS